MKIDEFTTACKTGDYKLVSIVQASVKILNSGLFYACTDGHRDVVELLISKGANDWNSGLDGSCRGGHTELAEYMIDKGAYNLNEALWFATTLETVELLIKHGANDWNKGLRCACITGNKQIVDLMIKMGANDWNISAHNALLYKHRDIAKLMIENGANNWYGIFSTATDDDLEYLLPTIHRRQRNLEYQLKELNEELTNRKRKRTPIDI